MVGRIILTLGLLLVLAGGAAGAMLLLKEDESPPVAEPPPTRCAPTDDKNAAREAQRQVVRKQVRQRANSAWFAGSRLVTGRFARDTVAQAGLSGIPASALPPAVTGEGWVVLVSVEEDRRLPHLPGCVEKVAVVYVGSEALEKD